jgi:heme A synthase
LEGRVGLLGFTVFLLFSLIVVGSYVAAGNFGEACGSQLPADWPLCNGNLLPPPQLGAVIEYSHRLLAALSALFLLVTTALYWKARSGPDPAARALGVAVLLLIFQIFLGALVVANELEIALVALHQAVAILVFGFCVAALSFGRG